MSSDRTARAGLVALGVANVVLLALLFSRSSAPTIGALSRAGLQQESEAAHGRKLLASLVGEELAGNPEQFRRRLQQAFQFAHCFSTYQYNNNYLVMNCPFFVIPTKTADSNQDYIPTSGASFAVTNKDSIPYLLVAAADGATTTKALTAQGTITGQGSVEAQSVKAPVIEATNSLKAASAMIKDVKAESIVSNGVQIEDTAGTTQVLLGNDGTVQATGTASFAQLAVQGKTQFADLEVANLAVTKALSVQGSAQVGDLAAASLAVSKSLSVQGSTQFGDLAAASLTVSKSLSVQGSTQFGDLAAASLTVSKSLSVQGSTQFGNLAAASLAVSKSLSVQGSTQFAGNVAAASLAVSKSLSVQGSTQFGNLAVANLNVTSLLRSTGKTQLSDLSVPALTVSGAASFGGDVTAAKSLRVLGTTALGTAGVTPTPLDVRGKFVAQIALLDNAIVKGEVQTRTMIASSNVAVQGDLWVSKAFTGIGKVTARGGLVANTCSCSGRSV